MPLLNGQVQVRSLVMGVDTPFEIINFNPWSRSVRAPSQDERAWDHGDWSGAEWQNAAVVPFLVCIASIPDSACVGDFDTWIEHRHQLAAAFSAIGDAISEVELRWRLGTREYVMFGRPRLVDPNVEWMRWVRPGGASAQCAFTALDPRIYAGDLTESGCIGLTLTTGGLTVPFTVPFFIPGTLSDGAFEAVNIGTANASALIRVVGPVVNPRIVFRRATGEVSVLDFFDITLSAGEWIDIDTAAGTALLNGLPTSSVRGSIIWTIDPFPLAPGVTTIRFIAPEYNPDACVFITFRSAWW